MCLLASIPLPVSAKVKHKILNYLQTKTSSCNEHLTHTYLETLHTAAAHSAGHVDEPIC